MQKRKYASPCNRQCINRISTCGCQRLPRTAGPIKKIIRSSSAHHPLIICSSSAHHLFIIRSSSAHHQFIISSSSVHHQLIICSSSAHHLFIIRSSSANHPLIISSSPAHHQFITRSSSSSSAHRLLILCSVGRLSSDQQLRSAAQLSSSAQ